MTVMVLPKLRFGIHNTHHSKDDNATHASHGTHATSPESTCDDEGLTSKQAEAQCIFEIKQFFSTFGIRLPQEKIFRYASFCKFDSEEAIDRIREDNGNPYMELKMKEMEDQFGTSAVFPLPFLRTRKNNSEVVYMKPARMNPHQGDSSDRFIDSLCYVLNDLSQTVDQCQNGVTVIADMQDATMENFTKEYCAELMQALQGNMVPTRVEAFLIVEPPSWFSKKVFKWMKSKKTSKDFLKRVHLIKQEQLSQFLMKDYQLYLPDDIKGGYAVGGEICEDYMDLKIAQEQQN
mmetsp:Transcript_43410/g.104900  ORF Transcript_43410/g.104900 Transcript_43410/m.104900 type:complete len:291 (+) Transcript_43410:65-937(+)|eukprot:CAMPEP_0113621200 /NCGR_PEP_ID=MMETSP0017_2-20120614/10826_1 /TAXON_ID=2856 /ORGANISM="Cylindrotheca closterium" /LENGTH=290 /DNA_ID=CAMNT_0000530925 /DNA_START=98 /DNA_END=970 /DNA_ORIENTATION=+ /assembly_acc=CAM_ASM_000147